MASIQALSPLLYFPARKTFCASRMQRLFEFIVHHPYLAGGAVLAAPVVAFYEIGGRIQAVAALCATPAARLMNERARGMHPRGDEAYDAGPIVSPGNG